ncbi:excinuclease ABC subunit UvrC [Spirochaetia bacterium 38H-sp]|uniref:UvrABC system protein C n=1 Tax=Rarispira pelagica TaxID=3141764 RepID=A0ABU9U9C7_9SPIR
MTEEKYSHSNIQKQISIAPFSPGVYLMKDKKGKIIYVGKAKVLRNRLRSYLSAKKDIKTTHLMQHVFSIEWIVTPAEYDALLLENTLIKKYQPKYNIDLKDGKTYPVIRITSDDFPRIFKTRRIVKDGSLYFGPFGGAALLSLYLDFIDKFFSLRKCKGKLKRRDNPCLYYHIGRCPAPCVGKISKEDYAKIVEDIKSLLSGDTAEFKRLLTVRMNKAAEKMAYEEAAKYRDAISALEEIERNEQKVMDFSFDKRDYAAYSREEPYACFSVFKMRDGKLVGKDSYIVNVFETEEDDFTNFLIQYYSSAVSLPSSVFIGQKADIDSIKRYIKEEKNEKLEINFINNDVLFNMVLENAREELSRHMRLRGNPEALLALQDALELPEPPLRIEGFDIAHLNGSFPYASMVQFLGGVPNKSEYRLFSIKSLKGLIDDYQSIKEAVARRYSRLLNEKKVLPDLILIDGGKGQVNAAFSVLDSIGLSYIPVIGLAKKEEEIFMPNISKPLVLDRRNPALKLLQYVRDEAHRFATGANTKARKIKMDSSLLEAVDGIGKKRAASLLKEFSSIKKIASADEQKISLVSGLSIEKAAELKSMLNEFLRTHEL